MTAVRADVPIVPVAIKGTRSILRADSWFLYRDALSVTVGDRIDGTNDIEQALSEWQSAARLRNLTRAALLALTQEPDLGREEESVLTVNRVQP